jgi:hypothetical protein
MSRRKRYHVVILKVNSEFNKVDSILINSVISHAEAEIELRAVELEPSIIDRFDMLEDGCSMTSFTESHMVFVGRMDIEKPRFVNI